MTSQEDIQPDSPSGSNSKDAMFEPKPKTKLVRVLTVLAYVLSVSMAAILLSTYYICIWKPVPLNKNYTNTDTKSCNGPKAYPYISAEDTYSNRLSLNYTEYQTSTGVLGMATETIGDYEVDHSRNVREIDVPESDGRNKSDTEMQQQLTAIESEAMIESSTSSPTVTEESVTWSDDYETLEEMKKSSIFIKKLLNRKKYENY